MEPRKLIRRYVPIMMTIIVVIIIEFVLRGTMSFTVAPAFAMIVMSIYHGGSLSSIISGLIVSGYVIYAAPDPIRVIIIILSIVAIIAPIVLMRRTIDNGDRVLRKLMDIDTYLAGAVYRWQTCNEVERLDLIKEVHYKIAHIRTLARGWHDLAMERDQVIDDYNPKT